MLLGNNKACKIAGIGSVNIKMHDGYDRVLTNVRYVPELRKNLITLGMLDNLGCLIKVENGYMKIIKGVMNVMKGKLSNGLYSLIGDSMIGTVASVSKKEMDVATL